METFGRAKCGVGDSRTACYENKFLRVCNAETQRKLGAAVGCNQNVGQVCNLSGQDTVLSYGFARTVHNLCTSIKGIDKRPTTIPRPSCNSTWRNINRVESTNFATRAASVGLVCGRSTPRLDCCACGVGQPGSLTANAWNSSTRC